MHFVSVSVLFSWCKVYHLNWVVLSACSFPTLLFIACNTISLIVSSVQWCSQIKMFHLEVVLHICNLSVTNIVENINKSIQSVMKPHERQPDFITSTTHKYCCSIQKRYEWMSFIIEQSDREDFTEPSLNAAFLLCQKVSSNCLLPGALQYKASAPQAQQAENAMNPRPVCTGAAPSLTHTRRRTRGGHLC